MIQVFVVQTGIVSAYFTVCGPRGFRAVGYLICNPGEAGGSGLTPYASRWLNPPVQPRIERHHANRQVLRIVTNLDKPRKFTFRTD
jgi:hypothetical protein